MLYKHAKVTTCTASVRGNVQCGSRRPFIVIIVIALIFIVINQPYPRRPNSKSTQPNLLYQSHPDPITFAPILKEIDNSIQGNET